MTSKKYKVFAIGFQKTGTSSLGKALEILGYNVCGYWQFKQYAKYDNLTFDTILERAYDLVDQYDAFKDTPWPVLYKELDQKYPNSKFILVIRDTDKWINSVVNDFSNYENSIHKLIYGVGYPKGNESIWIKRYENHNNNVINYFQARPSDFLLLYMDKKEVCWEKICNFLEEDIPDCPWPKVNQRFNKKVRMFIGRIFDRLSFR